MSIQLAATADTSKQTAPLMSPGPLFVIGVWRSGTSLLHALLNQHPRIRLMYESDLPLLWPLFLVPCHKRSWISKWEAWNAAISRHQIDTSRIPEGLYEMPYAMRAVCRQHAQDKGATIWGCKSPNYYDRLNTLSDLFPHAKFVVIWRDLAEICYSIAKAGKHSPWFARRGMELRAILGYHRLKIEVDRLSQRGRAIHQLNYEQLTQDPASCMNAVCDFLGIAFDPRMTSLHDADHSAVYAGEHHAVLKGSAIVAPVRRSQVLRPELKAKIDRYVVYWRRRYDGSWPKHAELDNCHRPARALERLFDRVPYALLRSYDLLTPLVYLFVPLGVWSRYRKLKQHSSPQPQGAKSAAL